MTNSDAFLERQRAAVAAYQASLPPKFVQVELPLRRRRLTACSLNATIVSDRRTAP